MTFLMPLIRISRYACRNPVRSRIKICTRHLSNYERSQNLKFHTRQEAIETIKQHLLENEKVEIFLGTGQYFHHETNDRLVALSFIEDEKKMEPPRQLLDGVVNSLDIEKIGEEISLLPECLLIKPGEVDSVHDGPWSFGYATKPEFSVFSESGYKILLKSFPQGYGLRLFDGSLSEDIYLRDLLAVQVALAEEPWNERKVELLLKNNDILTVVEDYHETGSSSLSELMMSSEWLVKMSGLICLMARKKGGAKDVMLRLPSVLRADGNPWIEMRNMAWVGKVHETE